MKLQSTTDVMELINYNLYAKSLPMEYLCSKFQRFVFWEDFLEQKLWI